MQCVAVQHCDSTPHICAESVCIMQDNYAPAHQAMWHACIVTLPCHASGMVFVECASASIKTVQASRITCDAEPLAAVPACEGVTSG